MKWIALLMLLAAGPQVQLAAAPAGVEAPESLLRVLDRYADLYRESALHFACDESIRYDQAGRSRRQYELEYIYVYTEKAGLRDYRTLRGKVKEVSLSDYDLPSFVERAYSWVFTFERAKWRLHRYKILGNTTMLGRDAIVMSFEPLPPYSQGVNDWFGRAWVDADTHQLLKVEALTVDQHFEQQRLDNVLSEVGPLPGGNPVRYVISKVTTEFAEEKNGLRFPSSVQISRTQIDVHVHQGHRSATTRPVFRIQQAYSNYRFFSVRTLDEVREYLLEH